MIDRRRGGLKLIALASGAAIVAVACTGLDGLADGNDPPDAGPVGPEGSAADTSPAEPADSGACPTADLQSDPKQCGRCGHDCLGGACTAGTCEAVVMADGLGNPTGLALGPSDVYVTASSTGVVFSLPKLGGAATALASNEKNARGVAVIGTRLYWGNGDYAFNDAGSRGGIWQCMLPNCTNKQLLAPGDFAAYPVIRGSLLYFASVNDDQVKRVPLTGGPPLTVALANKPFGLAVDDVHVYYTSRERTVSRALGDGGTAGSEQIVGSGGDMSGFLAVDDARAYWAYSELNGSGSVIGAAKDLSGSLSYGTSVENVFPVGIAVDADNVYWSTAGTTVGLVPNGDGKIFACKKTGCVGAAVLLASGNRNAGPMALDDSAIYWVEYGTDGLSNGRLRKVAKP